MEFQIEIHKCLNHVFHSRDYMLSALTPFRNVDDLDQPCQGRCSTEIMGLKFRHSELPPVTGDSTKFEI
jgi:hypothetical protein